MPWRDVIGMRARIVHDYDEFDIDVAKRTIGEDLPAFGRPSAATSTGHPVDKLLVVPNAAAGGAGLDSAASKSREYLVSGG